MSIASRVRSSTASAAPDHTSRIRTAVPAWLLLPGLVMLAVSLFAYVQLVRHYPIYGLDLHMYRGALQAFFDGRPAYRLGYTHLNLPYTYPPITLIFLAPLIWTDASTALTGMTVAGLIAVLIVLWRTTAMLRYRGVAGRVGIVAAVTALLVWTEPFQQNFSLGQVNILVMLPVVIDLSLSDKSRFKGIGIGIATASKLLPGLFVVYLVLTRRIRAAVTACITFAVLTAIGWGIDPSGSNDYWIRRLAFDSHRVLMTLGPRFTGNQSLQGLVTRFLGTDAQNSVAWMVAVAVAAVACLGLAVLAHRRGEEALGMVVVGITTLLISPVSWSHYWVWIAPMLLVLVDVARRATGHWRTLLAGLPAVAMLPFLMWPLRATAHAPLLPNGLVWVSGRYVGLAARLTADPYIPTVVVLGIFAALWLWRTPAPAAVATPTDEGEATTVPGDEATTVPGDEAVAADTDGAEPTSDPASSLVGAAPGDGDSSADRT